MSNIAVIETGGKQHVVTDGTVLTIEKLADLKVGDKVTFDKVLLTDDGSTTAVGTPHLSGAKVSAEVLEQGRGEKITVIHYRQKSRYFKKAGHKQLFTKVKVTSLK
jgi:large subunit ribosomal protein L21